MATPSLAPAFARGKPEGKLTTTGLKLDSKMDTHVCLLENENRTAATSRQCYLFQPKGTTLARRI